MDVMYVCTFISFFSSKFWNELETVFIHDHISAGFFFFHFDYYFQFFILESSAYEMFWNRANSFSFFCYSIQTFQKGNGRIMDSFWDIPSRKYQRRNVVWRFIMSNHNAAAHVLYISLFVDIESTLYSIRLVKENESWSSSIFTHWR